MTLYSEFLLSKNYKIIPENQIIQFITSRSKNAKVAIVKVKSNDTGKSLYKIIKVQMEDDADPISHDAAMLEKLHKILQDKVNLNPLIMRHFMDFDGAFNVLISRNPEGICLQTLTIKPAIMCTAIENPISFTNLVK